MDDAPAESSPETRDPREVVADDLVTFHHPVRRRIVEHLGVNGPATVGTLAADLGQQVGSISHHLKSLVRAGYVEPAPELARDRRESWWRSTRRTVRWSISDFADSETDTLLAVAAERANLQHHVDKVLGWYADREQADAAWVDVAFATETWARATPAELEALGERLVGVLREFRTGCEAAEAAEREVDDAAARASLASREPVLVFAHANPARP